MELLPFPFAQFPPHVRQLRNYAWKPLLMYDAIQRYEMFLCVTTFSVSTRAIRFS